MGGEGIFLYFNSKKCKLYSNSDVQGDNKLFAINDSSQRDLIKISQPDMLY